MFETHIKEAISRSYAKAVSADAGISCEFYDNDYGLDGHFCDVKYDATRRGYRSTGFNIDFQLKATQNANIVGGEVIYQLEVKNYKDLIETHVGTPRILILFIMPEDRNEWINVDKDKTVMKKCAYWMSLKGMPDTTNTAKITIKIPENQILNQEQLLGLMNKVKTGGSI